MSTRITPQPPYADVLAEFATMGPDWYPGGSVAIADTAIVNARAFLDAVHEPRLSVHPLLSGGVQVEIHERGQDMEIEFHPDGRVEFCYDRIDPPHDADGVSIRTEDALRWWRHYWLGEKEDEV